MLGHLCLRGLAALLLQALRACEAASDSPGMALSDATAMCTRPTVLDALVWMVSDAARIAETRAANVEKWVHLFGAASSTPHTEQLALETVRGVHAIAKHAKVAKRNIAAQPKVATAPEVKPALQNVEETREAFSNAICWGAMGAVTSATVAGLADSFARTAAASSSCSGFCSRLKSDGSAQ
ncbi:hypothetical protein ERJ75_001392600 [Trypanosoma vivax]|nr:hypothetical protein ERJ75_001392600 [Trypanosoma vivax]